MLILKNTTKLYNHKTVVENVNLEIEDGAFVCMVGESGSGKTTLLKLIAGLIKPDRGEIIVNGKKITEADQYAAMVFQNAALLPWLNVFENIKFV